MRKLIFSSALAILMSLVSFGAARGQETSKSAALNDCDRINPGNFTIYKKWVQEQVRNVSLCIPSNLKRSEKKCIGGGCIKFQDDELYISFDFGISAGRPTFEKRYSTYKESFAKAGNQDVWIWSYEDAGEYKRNYGMNFLENGRAGTGIYVFAKSADASKVAETIFHSVKIF